MNSQCLFCQIAAKQLSTEIVIEGTTCLVIKDKFPKAPVHLLIIPKQHREAVHLLTPDQLKEIFKLSRQASLKMGVSETGYRLAFNVGRDAGQEIEHVHLHLLGGASSHCLY